MVVKKRAAGRSVAPDPQICILFFPIATLLKTSSYLCTLIVPLEEYAEQQGHDSRDPPSPIFLIENGHNHRQTTSSDGEFGVVCGEDAPSDQGK
jgi:hypothetical protein